MSTFDLYIGTYTKNGISKGIHYSEFNSETGELTTPSLVATLNKPSFLAIHSTNQWLYSVTEGTPGVISAFSINKETKQLTLINQVYSGGEGPCHVSLSKDEGTLFVTNYQSGSVATLPVLENGALGEPCTIIQHKGSGLLPERQSSPHAHSAVISPNNHFLYVSDLGKDEIVIYSFYPESNEISLNIPECSAVTNHGAGPRHFTFHPNGKWAYGVNELESSVTTYHYSQHNGHLFVANNTSIIPEAYRFDPYKPRSEREIKSQAAEVAVHPNGRFLYCSNRGFHSIAIFELNKDGKPQFIGYQTKGINEPRHFTIDPTGSYCIVANQNSNNVTTFKINKETGWLEPTNKFYAVGEPICLMFAPTD